MFCRITKIKDIANAKQLQHIGLGYNFLMVKELDMVTNVRSLLSLDVSYNCLEDLPLFATIISKIVTLQILNAKGNAFCLQHSYREFLILKLPQLKYLDEVQITKEEKKLALQKTEADIVFPTSFVNYKFCSSLLTFIRRIKVFTQDSIYEEYHHHP